jgi:Fe-S cluster assembly ATP-binding protein
MPLLEVEGVTFQVSGNKILDGLDLAIEEQEVHALLGANGSGKTTLAYMIMGCEGYQVQSGEVRFAGQQLDTLPIHERAQRGIALAWQEPARFEGLSVHRYLTLRDVHADPAPYLRMLGLAPGVYLPRFVDKSLSGGERKRIELASVLALHPKLAMLDEPASGVDILSIQDIIGVIRALKQAGTAVLLISHQEDVALMADRASLLCGGRIIYTGEPKAVVEYYKGRTCVRCDGRECAWTN